jgi:hypothetical protein
MLLLSTSNSLRKVLSTSVHVDGTGSNYDTNNNILFGFEILGAVSTGSTVLCVVTKCSSTKFWRFGEIYRMSKTKQRYTPEICTLLQLHLFSLWDSSPILNGVCLLWIHSFHKPLELTVRNVRPANIDTSTRDFSSFPQLFLVSAITCVGWNYSSECVGRQPHTASHWHFRDLVNSKSTYVKALQSLLPNNFYQWKRP